MPSDPARPRATHATPEAARAAAATVLAAAPADAVGALAAESAGTLATVLTHASIRRFAPEPLPDDVVAALEAALVRGPTSSALHSYTHVLVREPERKRRMAHLAGDQRWIDEAPLLVVGCADLRRTRSMVHARGYRYTAHDLRMLVSATADLTVGLQNASLVAQSLGYGTVMLGGVLNGSLEIAQDLGLPARVVPLVGLAIGRPADDRWPAPRPRLPLPLLVHHESWSLTDEEERALLEAHDAETCARRHYEGRRIPWAAMGRPGDDPVPLGAYGVLEHVGRKQGRATWGPQGAKVDRDLPALGLKVRGTGDVDDDEHERH
jgi:FMN reductase [NAD(P)H]